MQQRTHATTTAPAAASALSVLGADYTFPNQIEGLPVRLSDFDDLKIGSFQTNDGVRLSYWEAGSGQPLIFIPGWSANGAEYINVLYLLREHYHVHVLDPRNQGLSQRVEHGNRISRYAMDVREFAGHLGLQTAYYCGWSMGAAILWGYMDLFGTDGISKAVFIDQSPSIYCHMDWCEQERLEAGAITGSPERMIDSFATGAPANRFVVASRALERYMAMDSPYYQNSESFARHFIATDMNAVKQVLFDHVMNDWRDVIRTKITVPVAIFSGEFSDCLQSQRWMQSVIPGSVLYVYTGAEQGDHFLAMKNPVKFARDLQEFLEREGAATIADGSDRLQA